VIKQLFDSAAELDRQDELRELSDAFWIPPHGSGGLQAYFCGHSLGLQPRTAEAALQKEMRRWRELAVGAHFRGRPAWIDYGDELAASMAGLVGARPSEVTLMNSLTVNLHLLMISFFRPSGRRCKIVMERAAFPSDRYAVQSQLRLHGLDPADHLVELGPESGADLVEEAAVESYLQRHGEEVALVLWPGVQYASGQAFDLARIAAAGHAAGARVGFDLAHSAGNLPLSLHDSGCDFAAWCTYKYLNGGPGAVAAVFIHGDHVQTAAVQRLEGWWGNDRRSRFRMEQRFDPAPGAEAWQLSTPPVLAMAPLRASLALFREAGMDRLRQKSRRLTAWLADALESRHADVLDVLTPDDPERRGCQLSLRVHAGPERGRRLFQHLESHGVIADWREPDIIRVAPVPLYTRFRDCAELVKRIEEWSPVRARVT
jgi:kynureninase